MARFEIENFLSARFNVLGFGLSNKRTLKRPLEKLSTADHAINSVAKSRLRRKARSIGLKILRCVTSVY